MNFMKRTSFFFLSMMFLLSGVVIAQNTNSGYWKFKSSKHYRLAEAGSGYTYSLITEGETIVIYCIKNPTFERPDASGKYDGLPVGYEVKVKMMWQTPATTLKPGDAIGSGLSVEILASSKNPQDANMSFSPRIFFTDVNAKKTSAPAYQVPYSIRENWIKSGTSDAYGPKASWSGERKNRMTVSSKVPTGSDSLKKLGVIVRFSDFGYWLYEYDWIAQ